MSFSCNFGLVAIETRDLWTSSQLPTVSQRMGADIWGGGHLQGLILLSVWWEGSGLWALGRGHSVVELEATTRVRVWDGYSGVSTGYRSQAL